jgi:hypothetical protein
MTAIEFRLFFESLPDKLEVGKTLPTKKAFTLESGVPTPLVKENVNGSKTLNDSTINKLLPVMRRYGFQG